MNSVKMLRKNKFLFYLKQMLPPKINYSTDLRLKSFSEIPGPKVYPLIGNLFELKSFGLFLTFFSSYYYKLLNL